MISKIVFLFVLLISIIVRAHDHIHPPHNMVLFGIQEFFASHIVYKKPHQYQVILQVNLDATTRKLYLDTVARNPTSQMILLLDSMEIGQIESKPALSAKLIESPVSGERKILLDNVQLKPADYKIIFFDEVPLNLNP